MSEPASIATELRTAVSEAAAWLAHVDEARTAHRPRPGAWCAREVLGHLIDSACCNHRRFVTGQSPEVREFGGYEQNAWVERQRYHDASWGDLLALWTAYNRHLAYVMEGVPPAALNHAAPVAGGEAVTLGFLMQDYVRHLRHHLTQLRSSLQ